MSDLKQVLSEEIRRLARKEVKLAVQPLQANIVALRRQVSELKKMLADANKKAAVMQKKAAAGKNVDPADEEEPKLRLSAAGIIRIRKKLKVTQGDFAKLLGVSLHTVSSWEKGKSYPRANAKAKICALRTVGKRQIKALLDGMQKKAVAE